MQKGQQELFNFLCNLNIDVVTKEHEAIFTVAEGENIKRHIAGAHTKNLFLKDKKSRYFLVTLEGHAKMDLKNLHSKIGASGRLSFGSAEKLQEYLGLYPGAVSVFGLINDVHQHVTIILDSALMQHKIINCHPMTNQATTSIKAEDLIRFIEATNHQPYIIEVSEKV